MSVSGREPGPQVGRGTGTSGGSSAAWAALALVRSDTCPNLSGRPPGTGWAAAGEATTRRPSRARTMRIAGTLTDRGAPRAGTGGQRDDPAGQAPDRYGRTNVSHFASVSCPAGAEPLNEMH